MPNHITTIIEASEEVIKALLNDKGEVDFNMVIPAPEGLHLKDASGFIYSAEKTAESVCMDAAIGIRSAGVNVLEMDEKTFEQFVMMMRNKRNHGFCHIMQFAREKWGTKWNAYEQEVSEKKAKFDTAWSHPAPVILELSKKFPEEQIKVQYADEDLGSNCGQYVIKDEVILEQEEPGHWRDMTNEGRAKWRKFAANLRYPGSGPEEFDCDENWNYIE